MSSRHGLRLHIFHVSRTRMIAQGTDGVSRGDQGAGIMAGEAMNYCIPIHKSALERNPPIVNWVCSWAGDSCLVLELLGWFTTGHYITGWSKGIDGFDRPIFTSDGSFMWLPPPFVADVAIAEMRKARIKRQSSSHVFVCPRMCSNIWLRHLYKAADIVLEFPAGSLESWPDSMQEPLLIGILFPFIRVKPWQLRNTPKMYAVGRELRGMRGTGKWMRGIFCANFGQNVFGLGTCERMWCGKCYSSNLLEKNEFFIATPDQSAVMPDDEDRITSAWKVRAADASRFKIGRNDDDLLVSFECDFCILHKLYHCKPNVVTNEVDKFSMSCIRRINLDAFWSRASSTVLANATKMRESLALSERLGLLGTAMEPGPLPRHDHCGYEVALQIVVSSLDGGKYSDTHKQWDTIRKLRSCYSNQVRASYLSNSVTLTLADNAGSNYQRLSVDPCGSLWFSHFMTGCKKRMGQDWKPNKAISVEIMAALLSLVEHHITVASEKEDKIKWILAGTYFCYCFVLPLRSPEGLLTDLEGLFQFYDTTGQTTIIPLLGRLKGEDHSKQHLMHSANVTDSGIQVRRWTARVLAAHRFMGRSKGPAFINSQGSQSTTAEMNSLFISCLVHLLEDHPVGLFGPDIKLADDIAEKYHVFRSFRRGSESRAVSKKVSEADRYIVNRWRKKEVAGASRVNHAIDQHYVDVSLVSPSFLRYTKAM